MKTNLNKLAKEIHKIAKAKGFYNKKNRSIAELIALIHCELSEAFEETRLDNDLTKIYYKGSFLGSNDVVQINSKADKVKFGHEFVIDNKPLGFPTEIADTIIRLLDLSAYLKIDIDKVIKIKMEYNKTRPYKHGKKF